ncbi:carbon-phosphorus lyase complex subunit PhnI [Guggenheimella bovis]
MGYVAVKGGVQAIKASIERLDYERLKNGRVAEVETIKASMRFLIDQLMSEASLYDETLASLALKQAEGSPEEGVFLLRAYRSTLERNHYSNILDAEDMFVERRISSSFKDIPEGQILGSTTDYVHRLLDFSLLQEDPTEIKHLLDSFEKNVQRKPVRHFPKVVEILRKEGIVEKEAFDDTEPNDVTKESLRFPSSRSERLQVLTRGQTGAVTSLGYAALRAYGLLHPTIAECRVGRMAVTIPDPEGSDDGYYIGEVRISEVESFIPHITKDEFGEEQTNFSIGYGICFGQNETKAIAMSLLDASLEAGDKSNPVQNEEFVLLHIDSVESTGFISHLKLPHYVTFQSKLDAIRKELK